MKAKRNHLVPIQNNETCACLSPDESCRQLRKGHEYKAHYGPGCYHCAESRRAHYLKGAK